MKQILRHIFLLVAMFMASTNAWALRYAKAIAKSSPTQGGWVWVTKTDGNAPSTWDRTEDSSENDNGKISDYTFPFYYYAKPQAGYEFKGWAITSNTNTLFSTVQTNWYVGVTATSSNNVKWDPATATYYAIFAKLTTNVSSLSFEKNVDEGWGAENSLVATYVHAGDVIAKISGEHASDFSFSNSSLINQKTIASNNTDVESSQTIYIYFNPSNSGNRTATLTFSGNGMTKTVIMNGKGIKLDQTLSWNNESAIETNMQLGKTQTVTATATSGLAVTYSSSDNSVLTVDASGKITAVGIGNATITASQVGNYKYNAAAPSITKSYTVWNKNTPIFTPNGFNEANVCHLKVGDKVTLEVLNVSDGLSGDFKVKTDNNILGITRNGNSITIEALNAGTADAIFTQTENNDIFGAEKKYQFSVSKINNTLAIASSSYTKYVDDEITNIISSVNSDATVTTSSSDATIAYYDVTSDKIFIPNSEAKSFSSQEITITIAQAETYKYTAAKMTITLTVNKYSPKFTWNTANTPYYYGTSIPNIFSTTNPDVVTTFTSDNEAFARVENNTLYIANARETATITVSQPENYKWYSNSEQYVIAPVNGNNHVPFKIDSEAKYNSFRQSTSHKCSWSGNRINFYTVDWSDKYYDIHFEGIPNVVTFNYDADGLATDIEWYVQESNDGINWSDKLGHSTSKSGSASVTLQSSTRYLRFCYSGNLNGYISNIEVTERFQFEATPTAIDFGSKGIIYGMQHDTVTFLHANAGRITTAVITGTDAKYFSVTPELIPGTGRDCFGNATLEVTFDNLGEDRGATPYKATLTISDNSDKTADIHIPLTGIRDGKSTADIIWNPNALPYYFNTTIANIAYSTNRDANCPLTFTTTDNTIAEVKNGDLHIYNKGQEVTITVTQPGNADFMPATKTFTFTPCERPNLEAPFLISQALHAKSVQLGTKSGWYQTDNQIRIASTSAGDGFIWGDERKRVLITFAGTPDKLYFEYCSSDAATPELATHGWEVEESANGTDWNTVWRTGSLSASWKSSGEIDLSPNTQYIRFSYQGNFAGYLRNIIISSLEGNSYLRAEEGGYLSRGAKWGTQAIVDPFGIVCRVSHFTVDNTNIYTRLQFVDNMQYLYETADTKEVFTDAEHANNSAYLWQINSDASGKFTVQSANNLDNGNRGNYFTLIDNTLSFTSDPAQATVWHMETPAEHNNVVKSYMDAAAAKAAENDFGSDINTLEKVRSSLNRQDFEITEVAVPEVPLAEQAGVYRDEINGTGTFAVYDNTISGLKPGFYRLTVKALYRISDSQKAQAAKNNGWESVLAYIYANDVKYPIQSVYTSYNAGSYDSSDEIYNGYSYPTKLNSVERAFNQDHNRYLNDVYVYVEADPEQTTGTLRYGIKNPSYVPGAWLAYSTITLTHFGRKEYVFVGNDSEEPADWQIAENWETGTLPGEYHNVRIEADVNIDRPIEVYGISVVEGKNVHITSTGGLTVGKGGVVSAATGTITIDNTPDGAGFLKVDPTTDKKPAKVTINYTTKAFNSGNPRDEIWQYMGAPGNDMQMSDANNTMIYHWNEQQGWLKMSNTSLQPFVGYAFTQNKAQSANFQIQATPIIPDKEQEITLTLTQSGMRGSNLFVNSFLAPIDLATFDDIDFTDGVEQTFYLYNSGSWNQWQNQGGADNVMKHGVSPGQYYALSPKGAELMDPQYDQTTIPPMQGVYVVTQKDGAKIYLDYAKHVYKAEASNQAMRAPQRQDDNFKRVRLQVNSQNSGADRMYVIQHNECTSGYDNGYDAKNMPVASQVSIYTTEADGQMEISVSDNIDSTYIGFNAGADTEYTLRMTSVVGERLYLKDLDNQTLISVYDGEEYTFSAEPNSVNDRRFLLLDQRSDDVSTDEPEVRVYVYDKMAHVLGAPIGSDMVIYTIGGVAITNYTIECTPYVVDLSSLPTGVYVLRINDKAFKCVCK